ncbi:MAG: choice-of-anchor D domain-containing protein [Actinomycetota bacterium]
MVTVDTADRDGQSATLSGSAIDRAISVAPLSLSFGAQKIAKESAPRYVTVANPGSDALHVSSVTLVGSSNFRITPAGGFTLAPNTQQRIAVTFTPDAGTTRYGTIHIQSDACNAATRTVELVGSGAVPTIDIRPKVVTLSALAGQRSPPSAITVTNSGAAPLTVRSIALSGVTSDQFTLSALPHFPVTLAPAGSFVFDIRSKPLPETATIPSATIVIASNDPKTKKATVAVKFEFATASPTAFAVPTPSSTPAASPKAIVSGPPGPGIGSYAGELLVTLGVLGVFATLVFLRDEKMRRVARRFSG